MTANVEKIAEQVKALPAEERDEFLSWLWSMNLGNPMFGIKRSPATRNPVDR